jgi:hypothetical protein
MAQPARSRIPIVLLALALVVSPVLAAGQPAARTPRDPDPPGVFASLWNALHGLFLVGEGDSGTDPEAPANAAPPPPADPDRGIMIDPWG